MRVCFCFVHLFLLVSQITLSQQPPTLAQALKSHHIDTSVPSLRQALLFSPDSVVRGLAANQLAFLNDKEAATLIADRLQMASSPDERLSMAAALLSLGEPKGHRAMLEACKDVELREDSRIIAAQQLDEAGDPACFGPLIELLSSASAFGTRQSILVFLKGHPTLKAPSPELLRRGLENGLLDESPIARQDAGECIVIFKVKSASISLKNAVIRESDPATKHKLQVDLRNLESSSL